MRRDWLAVVRIARDVCARVNATQYFQILTICPSPFTRSVAHKWLNFASGECSNMQENSFGSTVQILFKCSNRKRLLAQSSATTTQFYFVRIWGSKLSSTQGSKNQWNLGIGVRGNGETEGKSGGQKTIKRTRVKERDIFLSLSLPLLSLVLIFLSVWVCWVLLLFLRKPANLR